MSNNHSIPRLILRVPVEAAEAETADQPVLQQLFEDLAGSIKDTDTVHVYFPAGFLRRQREVGPLGLGTLDEERDRRRASDQLGIVEPRPVGQESEACLGKLHAPIPDKK